MTVYKAYMKITKHNTGLILLYVGIYLFLAFLFQITAEKDEGGMYTAASVRIGVIDNDKGPLAKGLEEYLGQFHSLTDIGDDNTARLQEDLYYRSVEYIIRIPAGFEKSCLEQNKKLPVTKVPGSSTSFYVDQQVDSFLNSVKTYYAAGYSTPLAVKAALSMEQPTVKLMDFNKNGGVMHSYMYFYRSLPYLILSILCYVLGNILVAFHKEDMQRRMQASAMTGRRKNAESLLAVGTLGAVLWGGCLAVSLLLYGKDFLGNPALIYYILNSLVLLLVSISIAYLIGILAQNTNARNGIINIVTLGMCFLCGVFVPMEFLGKGVKTMSQFLPLYWYEHANDLLIKFGIVAGTVKTQVWQAIGMQLLFAAALMCIAIALSKNRRKA